MQTVPEQSSKKLDLISHIAKFKSAEWVQAINFLPILILIVAALFFMQDLYVDLLVEGKGVSHVLLEGSIFLAVLLALGIEVKRVVNLSTTVSINQEEMVRLKRHLQDAITEEFNKWELTATEKEIALLLIKGLSMQEIAEIRNVKEKSVRQQATGIYSKANVSNRYELTSYFIEDLLAPISTTQPRQIQNAA